MGSTTNILVVGSTGMLGEHIVKALLARGNAAVRGMHRPGTPDGADQIRRMGATPVEADLLEPGTLPSACEGIDVIVSAVSGPRELIVGGQKNLIEVAQQSGVERFIPSDYGVDFFNLDYGDNYSLDMRKDVAEALAESTLRPTHILNGAFIDVAGNEQSPLFDLDEGTFRYYGDGEQPCDFTTVADAARYVAAAATDPDAPDVVRVAGDVLTMKEFAAAYSAGTGRALAPKSFGSVGDLEWEIEQKKQDADSPMDYVLYQYLWSIVSGKGKLDPLNGNERYADIEPMSAEEYFRKASA